MSKNSEETSIIERCKKKNIDELWDIISGCILKSAYKTLPSKEVKIRIAISRSSEKSSLILKDLRVLGNLCHLCIEKESLHIEEEERYKWSSKIRDLNERLDLEIEELIEEQ